MCRGTAVSSPARGTPNLCTDCFKNPGPFSALQLLPKKISGHIFEPSCFPYPIQQFNDSTAFQQLARLSAPDYDRARKAEAKRLGIRVETLDAEVARHRQLSDEAAALRSALSTLHSPLVWPEPV